MRLSVALLILSMMTGCTMMPPKPPECSGQFRPVNPEQNGTVSANTVVEPMQ